MDSLFGVEVTAAARFIIAFVVVLALIVVTAWLVRRFGSGALSSSGGRGRQPRLAVIEAASVDTRRKLVLVRRDNVEHLLMIGGPSDVVIEPNIVRAAPARDAATTRTAPIPETMPRAVPLEEETMWPLQPEPAPRPQRAEPTVAAQWSAAAPQNDVPAQARQPDALAELADMLTARMPPQSKPAPSSTPAPEPHAEATYATPENDQNLADMAQRLEAVLRKPVAGEPQPETPPSAEQPSSAPVVVAAASASEPEVPPSVPEIHPVPPEERPAATEEPRPAETKKFYETLEQEMASLLGRPTGKT